MQPREPSQPWPIGNAPTPAWTKTIDGAAYTVKRIQPDLFGVWRDAEELGIFQLDVPRRRIMARRAHHRLQQSVPFTKFRRHALRRVAARRSGAAGPLRMWP
ncbi:MAG TPA: hypothetical protein VJN18_26940, partial [Polyangiaceae bacterium]|nr:hypothetical protein [Polyangiaceae bacterium]